jgi:Holliday junction resolvase
MTEQQFQSKIIKLLEKHGYYCIKIIRANKNGTPDIVAIKEGKATFIEVKSSNGVVSDLQRYRIKEIQEHGARAFVVREGDNIIDRINEK